MSHEKIENSVVHKQLRKSGDFDNYVEDGDNYKCKTCGGTIMAARIHHPIWDGPFPMSGSGRVHVEEVPYCLNCEEDPSGGGSPIQC